MFSYKPVLIMPDNTTKDLPGACLMTAEEAEKKARELVDANTGKRSFMDMHDPSAMRLVFCDDPDKELESHLFTGPPEEIRRLQLFTLRYKSKKKRQGNIDQN